MHPEPGQQGHRLRARALGLGPEPGACIVKAYTVASDIESPEDGCPEATEKKYAKVPGGTLGRRNDPTTPGSSPMSGVSSLRLEKRLFE
ncbi:hypothetical protein TWF225_005480 [Orbilia oligospora]|nr:hypothetical protein TWF225_005480 [Orbilia oligospora]KAF3259890.1 hypothetical protein TWF128_003880 [Orbilia oligospora]KAF3270802.1 hypothetical protein TWF217_007077 [Orbilia oligospora]KAF3292287.1 hypothetical protein TWF132_005677 [Orbilia oligospora]